MQKAPTAAVLLIGDELLSGRTKDKNLGFLAESLFSLGVDLKEARVVCDQEEEIIAAVQALKSRYRYVFTTGGIGPTHDDITTDAVAKAFGVPVVFHPEALSTLKAYFEKIGREVNEARLRMARIPEGAQLIANSVSIAPGFFIDNVYVLAGIPAVMQAMFASLAPHLETGIPMRSLTVTIKAGEGDLALPLGDLQKKYAEHLFIGSYPFMEEGGYSTHIVLRSREAEQLEYAVSDVLKLGATLIAAGKARGVVME